MARISNVAPDEIRAVKLEYGMVGKTVFQYQLLEQLGSGGMGEVYKAQDTRLNRFVAIKVLPAKLSADPERRRRFIQEAQAASGLNHPNIITIFDILSEGNAEYMVMEFVAGETLHDLIAPGGLAVSQVLDYGAQIADALSTAHAAGIIHRDLKPSNIMVTPSGRIKILDFGLAKLMDLGLPGRSGNNATTIAPLTQEGAILGTVSYMSPEQAEGKPLDARSDIFSFGSVLYEMITGRRAFDAGSSISTLSSVLRDDVRPIGEVAPETPPLLEAILNRCLIKDPNSRWQSMQDVEKALSGLKRQLSPEVSAPTTQNIPARAAAVPAAYQPTTPTPVAQAPPAAAAKSSKVSGLAVGLISLVAVVAGFGVVSWWASNRDHQPTESPSQSPPTQAPIPAATPAPSSAAPEVPPLAPVAPEPATTATNTQPAPPRRPAVALTPVTLADGLPFRITLASDVPADAAEGQALEFTAVDGFKVGDDVVIPKGSSVTGAVTGETSKKKILGLGGNKLTFKLLQADAVDGKKVNVRCMSARRAGGPTVRTFETVKSSKVKGLAAAQGTEYIAYIDGDQSVSVRKP